MRTSTPQQHRPPSPLQQRETDYHSHILPGMDDGAKTLDEALEMARILAEAGYRQVHCTPHLIKGMYSATTRDVLYAIGQLQESIRSDGLPLTLLAGREYYLDEFFPEYLKEPLLMEGTNFLMIEIPSHAPEELVKNTIFQITCSGYTPLIAHPERCALLEIPKHEKRAPGLFPSWLTPGRHSRQPEYSGNALLSYLKKTGCQFQANLGSLNGQYGRHIQSNARRFDTSGTYTHAGTDGHSPEALRSILAIKGRNA